MENPLKIHWNVIENPLKKCLEKWLELCSNLIDFWSFWALFCFHFAPFWAHFGSFWTPPGVPGETSQFSSLFGTFLVSILAPFWCHFGSQNQHFSSQKLHRFFDWFLKPFWLHFGCLFGAISLPKSCQNRKRRFCENERLACTRCSFSEIRTPKIHPKIDEKSVEKSTSFLIEKSSEKWSKMIPQMPPKTSQNAPEKDAEKSTKKRSDL